MVAVKNWPTTDDIDGFLTRLNDERPRARILLEAGLLEELLRAAILKRLADNKSSHALFGAESALGLAVLAKHAHSLALIGDLEVDALIKFSKARNMIAHSWKADFSDPEMQKIVDKIQFVVLKGEREIEKHQSCFMRLDTLGLYMTEVLYNRFTNIQSTDYEGGVFLKSLMIDVETKVCTKKTETGLC